MKRTSKRSAFTLVELIVVLAILAILLVLVVPRVTGYIHDARLTAARSNASAVMDAAHLYVIDQETENATPAETLSTGGPLDDYLDRLGKDTYEIELRYNAASKRYDITGTYTSGQTTVQIPDLTVTSESEPSTD